MSDPSYMLAQRIVPDLFWFALGLKRITVSLLYYWRQDNHRRDLDMGAGVMASIRNLTIAGSGRRG